MGSGLHNTYLDALGIRRWVMRSASPSGADSADEKSGRTTETAVGAMDWEALQASVAGCTRCPLHETRTQTVFGTGNRNAGWMLVGEAPGADEDRLGEPFVGRAGQLLNEMLSAAGYLREQVYIANILKCRPPGNRNPLPDEVACCREYLVRQIELVQPVIILALGGIAAQNLLHTEVSVGRLRGIRHSYGESGIPVIVTYHPAYLLRSPLEKRKVWDDLQYAQQLYRELTHRTHEKQHQ